MDGGIMLMEWKHKLDECCADELDEMIMNYWFPSLPLFHKYRKIQESGILKSATIRSALKTAYSMPTSPCRLMCMYTAYPVNRLRN